MELKDYIKDFSFQFWVFLLIVHFILGKYFNNYSGYDAGKRFIWGSN